MLSSWLVPRRVRQRFLAASQKYICSVGSGSAVRGERQGARNEIHRPLPAARLLAALGRSKAPSCIARPDLIRPQQQASPSRKPPRTSPTTARCTRSSSEESSGLCVRSQVGLAIFHLAKAASKRASISLRSGCSLQCKQAQCVSRRLGQ